MTQIWTCESSCPIEINMLILHVVAYIRSLNNLQPNTTDELTNELIELGRSLMAAIKAKEPVEDRQAIIKRMNDLVAEVDLSSDSK